MTALSINQNKQWQGHFPGNYTGNIWASWNIDLEKSIGRIALSDKLRRFASALGVALKFVKTNADDDTTTIANANWFAITRTSGGTYDIAKNDSALIDGGTWAGDTSLNSPSDPRDMVIHESVNGEQRLIVTRAAEIAALNVSGDANAWDPDWGSTGTRALTLTSQTHHPIARLKRLLAIGDIVAGVPVIHTIDKDDVGISSRLSFSAEYLPRIIIASTNRFWIGLEHLAFGNAKIIEWDGFSLDYNNEYLLEGSAPLTGFIVKNIPYFITEVGYIFKFIGGGFEKVQDFDLKKYRQTFSTVIGEETGILTYGNYVEGDIVYLNVGMPMVESDVGATTFRGGVRRGRSGIWIFNTKNFNLYHHMGIGEFATNGTDINYGCGHLDMPGAIIKTFNGAVQRTVASASVFTGGANWQSGTTDGFYSLERAESWVSSAGRNRGYFITPYIPMSGIRGILQGVWVKFRRFTSDRAASPTTSDRIIIRWRTRDPILPDTDNTTFTSFLQAEGDWTSTTAFTCSVPRGISVDDMVEILTGDNAGCCFRISALGTDPADGTSQTVTIDEAAPTDSTDTFLCRFDNWESETAISSTIRGSQWVPCTAGSGKNEGEFMQIMVELRGFGVEIDDIIPVYKENQKLEM